MTTAIDIDTEARSESCGPQGPRLGPTVSIFQHVGKVLLTPSRSSNTLLGAIYRSPRRAAQRRPASAGPYSTFWISFSSVGVALAPRQLGWLCGAVANSLSLPFMSLYYDRDVGYRVSQLCQQRDPPNRPEMGFGHGMSLSDQSVVSRPHFPPPWN